MTQNNKLPVRPAGYRVLVKLEQVDEKSKGGIITKIGNELERAQLGHNKGVVMDIGPTAYKAREGEPRFDAGNWCEIGDTVCIPQYAGFRIVDERDDGKNIYHLINDEDVIGVFNE